MFSSSLYPILPEAIFMLSSAHPHSPKLQHLIVTFQGFCSYQSLECSGTSCLGAQQLCTLDSWTSGLQGTRRYRQWYCGPQPFQFLGPTGWGSLILPIWSPRMWWRTGWIESYGPSCLTLPLCLARRQLSGEGPGEAWVGGWELLG